MIGYPPACMSSCVQCPHIIATGSNGVLCLLLISHRIFRTHGMGVICTAKHRGRCHAWPLSSISTLYYTYVWSNYATEVSWLAMHITLPLCYREDYQRGSLRYSRPSGVVAHVKRWHGWRAKSTSSTLWLTRRCLCRLDYMQQQRFLYSRQSDSRIV